MKTDTLRLSFAMLVLVCLLPGSWTAVQAQAQAQAQAEIGVDGRVLDDDSDPLVGARVVYHSEPDGRVFISGPTSQTGEFSVNLPQGVACKPAVVLLKSGMRISLGELAAVRVAAGMNQEIRVPMSALKAAGVRRDPGESRLFLAFVEDSVLASKYRFDARFGLFGASAADLNLGTFSAAVQFDSIPRVEFGLAVGFGAIDSSSGGSESALEYAQRVGGQPSTADAPVQKCVRAFQLDVDRACTCTALGLDCQPRIHLISPNAVQATAPSDLEEPVEGSALLLDPPGNVPTAPAGCDVLLQLGDGQIDAG